MPGGKVTGKIGPGLCVLLGVGPDDDERLVDAAGEGAVQEAKANATIGSQVLASIFTDALGTDLEKVRLVNIAVRQIDPDRLASSPMPLRDASA